MARRRDESRKGERDERLREAAARAGGFTARRAYGEPRPREVSDRPLHHVWGGEGERGPLGAGGAGARGVLEHADPFSHDHRGLVESGYLPPGEEPGGRGTYSRAARPGDRRELQAPRAGFAGRGPKGHRWSDERIHEEVCERLTADPWVDARDVEVEVAEGQVTLRGEVPARTMRYRAEDLTADLPYVGDVANQLRVRRPDGG